MNSTAQQIVLLHPQEIVGVVRRTLSKIDPRLMLHGERVAYLSEIIARESPDRDAFDLPTLFVLSVLHDIGAYKTEEIDKMVQFETVSHFDHSLYGYLFLKNFSHLSDYAEAIRYHHTDYSVLKTIGCPVANYAEIIHLADRADILLHEDDADLSRLCKGSGTQFNPVYVDALLRADSRESLGGRLRDAAFSEEINALIHALPIAQDEVMDYLRLLVYSIDFRSPYTVTHTADTVLISREIGKLLELCDHELQALSTGAFLHDIGKIAIPPEILDKPDRLTPEEFDIIKTHIPEGEAILRGVVSDEICNIAVRHHEKLDGSGYSHGITGEALTLPERIVAVADIVSALSQERSYKKPFPKERVLAILGEMTNNGLLCPVVSETVAAHYDEIPSKAEKSHDPVKIVYNRLVEEYREMREFS